MEKGILFEVLIIFPSVSGMYIFLHHVWWTFDDLSLWRDSFPLGSFEMCGPNTASEPVAMGSQSCGCVNID